ncbi:MAG: DUF3365 domain-containing protein, partial [Desulfobacterales bacterium]|nr:DUF3365 domain-containing protein [Desulfobacterales bacterium]
KPIKKRRISLRLRFIFGLVFFVTALGLCISVIMYFHYNSIMQSEISQRSRMLLAQSDAIQSYVKTVLRPRMFDTLPKGDFILEAMSSSYISRQIMGRLGTEDAESYHYRRVSRNPRNPASMPDEFEAGLIRTFNQDKSLLFWEDTTFVKDREYHLVARPVTFTQSCQQCHGDPADAPGELIAIYGSTSGFHYRENEVGGVVVAGFPVEMIKSPARELTFQYLSLYLLGIFFFMALISLFFDQLVMKSLKNLTRIFETRFSGERELSIIKKLDRKDEIEGLMEGVDELAGCLSEARNELEDYAQNLEKMVDDRTRALDAKATRHLADMRLFVSLLSRFATAKDNRQLIMDLVESVGSRYNARQAVYYFTVVSEDSFAWKATGDIPALNDKIKDLLWQNHVLFTDTQLYIPVKSQESHWGILVLIWDKAPAAGELNTDILLALGQQMAILIENLHVFSNIRFQHEMLQSVFNGISDPLLLIDETCRTIVANHGARILFPQEKKPDQRQTLERFLCTGEQGPPGILERLLQTRQPVKDEIRTPDNRHFDVDLYPLGIQDGAMRMVLYARDITQEKEMLARMQQAERLSAIGKMAAGVAHEINNPLGVIQVYADLVKDAVSNADTVRDVDIILKHTHTAKNVVQNLLHLSRPPKTTGGSCDLNAVIASEMDIFTPQATARNIAIETDLCTEQALVHCHEAVVGQILTNLWLNAMDALKERGSRIVISTRIQAPGWVRMTMADDGSGISDEVLPTIFDPFFTTKKVGKGTGLGLSIIYGFITELGGRIRVENKPITRFCIDLPGPMTQTDNLPPDKES